MVVIFNVVFLFMVLVVSPSLGQICEGDELSGINYKCDGQPHAYHRDKENIAQYCGKTSSLVLDPPKITGGVDVEPGQAPWMVSLLHLGSHRCGGVLIDNYHVVTAAHCVILKYPYSEQGLHPDELKVELGTVIRHVRRQDNPDARIYDVGQIIPHRYYRQEVYRRHGQYDGYDIAILKLTAPVKFSSTIMPICLSGLSDGKVGVSNQNDLTLTGFGMDRHSTHKVLQGTSDLRLLNTKECLSRLTSGNNRTLHDGQLCVGPEGTDGAIACSGDSGGPLSQIYKGQSYLLGIVSYGSRVCSAQPNSYNIYTDIRSYLRWIESESLVDDGNGNQESVDENDASTDALAPGCLGAHCFDSETGRCVSKDSQFLLCDDEVICESDGTAGLQVAASVPKYTSPAGITGGFLTRGRFRRLCHKWGFLRRLRKWRCLTSTKRNRGRRQAEDEEVEEVSPTLICPVLSCRSREPIPGMFSSILETSCPEVTDVGCKTTSTNKACIFPFTYLDQVWNGCTNEDDDDGLFWCSTKVDKNGKHVGGGGHWGYCPDSCPKSTSTNINDDKPKNRKVGDVTKPIPIPVNGDYLPMADKGQCGKPFRPEEARKKRAVGGVNVRPGELPFIANLKYKASNGFGESFACSGTLINRRYVLTGHGCANSGRLVEVILVEVDMRKYGTSSSVQRFDVSKEDAVVHPDFRNHNVVNGNDIGLIRLPRPAITMFEDPDSGVLPACVAWNTNIGVPVGEVIASGWGKTSNQRGDKLPDILQKVDLPIVPYDECRKHAIYRKINEDNIICAGGIKGKDTCGGDSGGPLLARDNDKSPWYLVGVTSFGPSICGNGSPGAFTNIDAYIDWIKQNMKP